MEFQADIPFIKQFSANLTVLPQQMGSRLRAIVDEESGLVGDSAFFDQIGVTEYQEIVTRHGDTPFMNTEHARRMVVPTGIETGDAIDKLDKVQQLINFESPYVQAGRMALGRGIDDKIIAAATGTARTGKEGATSVVLPASQKVAITAHPTTPATSGLTLFKLQEAARILGEADVDPDLPRYFVCSERQKQDLLKLTETTSVDFNDRPTLVDGKITRFMGFAFIQTQRLLWAANVRTCFAFAKGGIRLGTWADMVVEVGKQPGKRWMWSYYINLFAAATRMVEDMVVEVACADTTGKVTVKK